MLIRLLGGAVLLIAPYAYVLPRYRKALTSSWIAIINFGVIAIAGMLGFFFLSIGLLPVTIAVLVTMLAPVLIVFWAWARTRVRPSKLTFIGVALALTGLMVLTDPQGSGVNWFGVILAICGAVCSVVFFLTSSRTPTTIPPVLFTGLGMLVGAAAIGLSSLTGALPAKFSSAEVSLMGLQCPWFIPMAGVVLCTASAFILTILGLRHISETVGSFAHYSQVPFVALLSWMLLSEAPTLSLVAGSVLILGGAALVKWGEISLAKRLAVPQILSADKESPFAREPQPPLPQQDRR